MPCALCNRWVAGWRHYTDGLFYCGQCKDSVACRVALDAAGLDEVLEQGEEAMVHYLYCLFCKEGRQAHEALIRQWAARALRVGRVQAAFSWLQSDVRLCTVATVRPDPQQLPLDTGANMPEPGKLQNGYVRCRHCDPPQILRLCPGVRGGAQFLCAVGNGWRRSPAGAKNWSCLQCATDPKDGFLKTGEKPTWLPEAWQLPMSCRVHLAEAERQLRL